MSALLRGVRLVESASRQLRDLPAGPRKRVAHVLEEMVAVVELTAPSIHAPGGAERMHFVAAGVRVEYSIDAATGLLTVHAIAPALAQAG